MKYCTRCGKEIMDEAVICPECGNEIKKSDTISKLSAKKTVNTGKIIKLTIAVVASLLIIAGGVVGFLFHNNQAHTEELESKLVNKTYQFKVGDVADSYFCIERISFDENGQYKLERVTADSLDVEEYSGAYLIKFGSDGTEKLFLGTSESDSYEIAVDSTGEIIKISQGGKSWDSIQHVSGDNLINWLAKVEFERNLKMNRKAALRLFAEITYWDTGDCFQNLIPIIFSDYEQTCEPLEGSNTEFIITVTGRYYFNKVDLPSFTKEGEISCYVRVDPESSVVQIRKDTGIVEAMKVYVVLSRYKSYGW